MIREWKRERERMEDKDSSFQRELSQRGGGGDREGWSEGDAE